MIHVLERGMWHCDTEQDCIDLECMMQGRGCNLVRFRLTPDISLASNDGIESISVGWLITDINDKEQT